MKYCWALVPFLLGVGSLSADEPAQVVPYRLSDSHHIVVRVRINGKGPFNFVVDTGCPILLISEPVGKKLGLKSDERKWANLDKLEIEGGLKLDNVKARVETPFQIEGMNSMGLAGVELHGLMGYTVLAKYRMQIDFTKDRMIWTPLRFDPPEPQAMGGAKNAGAGMDMMVTLVKMLSFIAGNLGTPPPQPRGFFGFEVETKADAVFVERILPKTPAAEAGLQVGDRIDEVEGKAVKSIAEVLDRAKNIAVGRTLRLQIQRGETRQELRITASDGL